MIPFIDLQAQRRRLGQPLEDAILKVVRSGQLRKNSQLR